MGIKKSLRLGLGPNQARLLSKLSSARRDEVFTMGEAKTALRISGPELRKLLHDLAVKRWIERIEKGKYLLLPLEAGPSTVYATSPLIIARKLVNPYYLGFATALNYYGLTEQVSRKTYIATTKKKRPLQFHSEEYQFVTLAEKRFFGSREEWLGDLKFNISDKEKTIVDCLFLPEYSGGLAGIGKAFKEELDCSKLYDYALRMEDQSVLKRLGYLLDTLKINPKIAGRLLEKVGGGFALLDSSGKKNGSINRKWRIIENIGINDLGAES